MPAGMTEVVVQHRTQDFLAGKTGGLAMVRSLMVLPDTN
jgi:hypothetical protein